MITSIPLVMGMLATAAFGLPLRPINKTAEANTEVTLKLPTEAARFKGQILPRDFEKTVGANANVDATIKLPAEAATLIKQILPKEKRMCGAVECLRGTGEIYGPDIEDFLEPDLEDVIDLDLGDLWYKRDEGKGEDRGMDASVQDSAPLYPPGVQVENFGLPNFPDMGSVGPVMDGFIWPSHDPEFWKDIAMPEAPIQDSGATFRPDVFPLEDYEGDKGNVGDGEVGDGLIEGPMPELHEWVDRTGPEMDPAPFDEPTLSDLAQGYVSVDPPSHDDFSPSYHAPSASSRNVFHFSTLTTAAASGDGAGTPTTCRKVANATS